VPTANAELYIDFEGRRKIFFSSLQKKFSSPPKKIFFLLAQKNFSSPPKKNFSPRSKKIFLHQKKIFLLAQKKFFFTKKKFSSCPFGGSVRFIVWCSIRGYPDFLRSADLTEVTNIPMGGRILWFYVAGVS
jgi:hypothetical protein